MHMELAQALSSYSKNIQGIIDVFFNEQEQIAKGIDDNLATSLRLLRDFSQRGGKAIRPFLVKTAFELAGGNDSRIDMAAAATELHHKHILILDDIADRDEIRYGGPTMEWAYRELFAKHHDGTHRSTSFAMLDAVWLGALAREMLLNSKFEAENLLQCQHILNTLMFRDTLAGWQIHALECDKKISEVSPEEFTKGLELVTARYTFEGPFKIGLALAGNRDEDLELALTKYSQKIGTAFQIYDDILGLFGETEKTGKPVGNDVREGKKTLLIQYAYGKASDEEKEFLENVTGNSNLSQAEINRVREIVVKTNSLSNSKTLAKKLVDEGIQALSKIKESEPKQHLVELASYIINREK